MVKPADCLDKTRQNNKKLSPGIVISTYKLIVVSNRFIYFKKENDLGEVNMYHFDSLLKYFLQYWLLISLNLLLFFQVL